MQILCVYIYYVHDHTPLGQKKETQKQGGVFFQWKEVIPAGSMGSQTCQLQPSYARCCSSSAPATPGSIGSLTTL